MNPAITINITNRRLKLTINTAGELVTVTAADLALIHQDTTLASWNANNVDAVLEELGTEFTCPISDSLIVDLYPAPPAEAPADGHAPHEPGDVYLAVVRRDPEETLSTHRVPLQEFRQAVARAAASEAAWREKRLDTATHRRP